MPIGVLVVACTLALQSVQVQVPMQPPRDAVQRLPDPGGTGIIRGHVIAADTGQPVAHAQVMLVGSPTISPEPPGNSASSARPATSIRPRSAQTDDSGGFEFTGLPAASYRLFASPPPYARQYTSIAYGADASARATPDAGTPFELANAQTLEKITLALPRGGVIAGRVTDETGLPLTEVPVYGLLYRPGSARGARVGSTVMTDDRGEFRLYGLAAGDYAVVAQPRNTIALSAPADGRPDATADPTGFIPTYYPSAPDEAGALRVKARVAAETSGVEIRVLAGRMYRISGFAVDSHGQPVSGLIMLAHRQNATGGGVGMGAGMDAQGRFTIRNVPAGDYNLVVRSRMAGPPANGQPPDPGEMAVVPVSVSSDIDGLQITTSEGASIRGHVVYEPSPADPSQPREPIRIIAVRADPASAPPMPGPSPAQVQADGSFTMKGLFGEYLLRPLSLQPGWYVKSISAGNDNAYVTSHAFKNGEDVTVVISTRASTLEGTVTTGAGEPATRAAILLLGGDKDQWRASSPMVHRAMTDARGHFRFTGLAPGHYIAVATTADRLNVSNDAATSDFFQLLAKDGTEVVVNEDEARTIDLRLVAGGS